MFLNFNVAMNNNKIFTIIAFLVFLFPLTQNAQEIRKEVRVTQSYRPSVSDAFKINVLPDIENNTRIYPDVEYQVTPRKLDTDFEVREINAAKMVPPKLDKYYKSYLKLGFGNYTKPLAQFYFNSLRDREKTYGAFLHHNSMNGRVKLQNGDRVRAHYNRNRVELFGNRIFSESLFSANLGYAGRSNLFYGYNTEIDTTLEKNDIQQKYHTAYTGLQYKSTHADSGQLNYDLNLDYSYTMDHYDFNQHVLNVFIDLNQSFKGYHLGFEGRVDYYDHKMFTDTSNYTVLKINPYFKRASDEWRFLLGINGYVELSDSAAEVNIFPKGYLQFNIVPGILIPYLGIDGNLDVHSMWEIANDNPYISPGKMIKPTLNRANIFVGLKGKFAPKGFFDIQSYYKIIDRAFFYVNDTSSRLMNQFDVIYDDMEVAGIEAGLNLQVSEKIDLDLNISYNNYHSNEQEHAWHMPKFKMHAGGKYNLRDKFILDLELEGKGRRYAKNINTGEAVLLDGAAFLNLEFEYRYNKLLSGFVRFDNILAQKYEMFYQYPSERFMMMLGFTYSL
jgi:hypothetical protein